jgi:hypothetical protein
VNAEARKMPTEERAEEYPSTLAAPLNLGRSGDERFCREDV